VNYLKHKIILVAIMSALAFNAHADSQKSSSDSVKPITTKANVNTLVPTSGSAVGKREAVKIKADQLSKAKKIAKAKSDKQAQTILLLKNNQSCGSWFDASGSTGDAAAYDQIKASGYTRYNAPAAVKKQIAIGVANCDKKYLVEKPTNTMEAKAEPDAQTPQQTGKSDEVDKKEKSEKGFFAKLMDSIKNPGSSNHVCSPGERVMHSDGC
jgi:hypothetical protein